jgi:hypothetical protein
VVHSDFSLEYFSTLHASVLVSWWSEAGLPAAVGCLAGLPAVFSGVVRRQEAWRNGIVWTARRNKFKARGSGQGLATWPCFNYKARPTIFNFSYKKRAPSVGTLSRSLISPSVEKNELFGRRVNVVNEVSLPPWYQTCGVNVLLLISFTPKMYALRPTKSVVRKPCLSHKHASRTTLFLGRRPLSSHAPCRRWECHLPLKSQTPLNSKKFAPTRSRTQDSRCYRGSCNH